MSCRYHDRDAGPCLKAGPHPGSPHICSRMKLVGLETMTVEQRSKPMEIGSAEANLYVSSALDGVLVRGNPHETWCGFMNPEPWSGRPCDCRGPLLRLPREQRRDLRAWIFAWNEYQRLAALIFDEACRSGLMDRWRDRHEAIYERLEAAWVDPHDLTEDLEDHGTDDQDRPVRWARYAVVRG